MSCFVIIFVTPATSCCSPNSCSPSCPTLSVPLSRLKSQCNVTYSSHTRTLSSPARYWLPAVVCAQLTVVNVSPLCAAVVLTMRFASSKCAEAFHLDVELGSHSSTMGAPGPSARKLLQAYCAGETHNFGPVSNSEPHKPQTTGPRSLQGCTFINKSGPNHTTPNTTLCQKPRTWYMIQHQSYSLVMVLPPFRPYLPGRNFLQPHDAT